MLREYLVKKDFLSVKAGEKIKVDECAGVFSSFELCTKNLYVSDHYLGYLVDAGWIEEVKPIEKYALLSPATQAYRGLLSVVGDLEFIKEYKKRNGFDTCLIVKLTDVED